MDYRSRNRNTIDKHGILVESKFSPIGRFELTEFENTDSREQLTEIDVVASTYLYRNESIKILALNILKQSDEIKFNDIIIPEQKPCTCCKGNKFFRLFYI